MLHRRSVVARPAAFRTVDDVVVETTDPTARRSRSRALAAGAAVALAMTAAIVGAVGVVRALDGTSAAGDAPAAIVGAAAGGAAGTRTPVSAGDAGAAGVDALAAQTATWLAPSATIDRIVLVGDSLAQETFSFIEYLTPAATVSPRFWGGTAPCDWLGADLGSGPSSVVVITFTGNSLTPCMADGAGGHLADDALVERYRADLGVLVDRARRSGARVVLVGQPYRAPSFDADLEVAGINEVLQQYAASFAHVSFVDAGAAVETPDGRYAERLPCTPTDSDCAPDGTTVVRGDGVHFCPIAGENPCSVWSSGAFRFGAAIAGAANDPAAFD